MPKDINCAMPNISPAEARQSRIDKPQKPITKTIGNIWSIDFFTLPLPLEFPIIVSGCSAVRLARQLRELEVPGSNPGIPTKIDGWVFIDF